MKTFINFSETQSFLDDLLEYSIHEPKYGAGEQVVVKTKKIDNPKEIMGINTIKQLESFEE